MSQSKGKPVTDHYTDSYHAPWIIRPLHPDWAKVIALGVPRSWPPRATVHYIGERRHDILLIRKGLLSLIAVGPGGEQRNIGILGCGALLGEASLFCGLKNSHMVQVVETCEGVVFSEQTMHEAILAHPSLVCFICENLAMKSYIMSTQLELQSFMNVRQRIAHFFYHLAAERQRGGVSWRRLSLLSLSRLSELLGMHRVTVSNIVNDLRREGILNDGKGFDVSEPEKLLEILEQPQ